MPRLTFVSPDGNETTVEASTGDSVMQVALAGNVEGIVAECGGAMMCATCHVYVADDWASRLSCQIAITDELDGLTVHLPDAQI